FNAEKWAVAKSGEARAVGRFHDSKEAALSELKELNTKRAQAEAEEARQKASENSLVERLKSGGDATDSDLKMLDLKQQARFDYLSPVVQRLFGISKMQ